VTRRRRIDPDLAKLDERTWQRRIDQRARGLGARTCHVRRAVMSGSGRIVTPTSDPGFPDLWCVFETGRLVVFECKRESAPPSAVKEAQRDWIRRLQRNPGIDAYVVRPSDWPHVEDLLIDAAGTPFGGHVTTALDLLGEIGRYRAQGFSADQAIALAATSIDTTGSAVT